jgi:hypothetical protein
MVSYNTKEFLLEALRSLKAETQKLSYEVIVVDNNSTDGSAEALSAEFPEFKMIARKDNLGFAKANNLAIKESIGEYLLLLNPDTVITDGAVDKLFEFAQKQPATIWGGRTLNADLTQNKNCCWQDISPWSLFCHASGLSVIFRRSDFFNAEEYGGWDRSTVREVDLVQGSFFLTTRKHWDEMNGFDEKYFIYGEEADFCMRTRKRGGKVYYTPDARVIHYGGKSEKVRSFRLERVIASKMQLILDHFRGPKRFLSCFFLYCWPLSRLIATSLLSTVAPNKRRVESAQQWREVMKNKGKWYNGFE